MEDIEKSQCCNANVTWLNPENWIEGRWHCEECWCIIYDNEECPTEMCLRLEKENKDIDIKDLPF